MALGTRPFNDNTGDLVFLTPRCKDKEGIKVKPYFQVGRKGADGKIATTDGDDTQVSGDLFRIEVKDRTFNGNVTKHVSIGIRDRTAKEGVGETYLLDLTFRNATRSLFNRLFSLETPEALTVGIFENAKGYETFYLRQNEQKVQWKFELESLPEPTLKRVNGKNVNDYEEVDAFFEKNLLDLAARLNVLPKVKTGAASTTTAGAAQSTETAATTAEKAAGSGANQPKPDDLPF